MLLALTLALLQQPAEPAAPAEAPPAEAPAQAPRLEVSETILFTIPEEFAEATVWPAFAPGGGRVAVAVYDVGERAFLVVDGVQTESRHYVRPPRFSADGKHVAWAWGERGKKDRDEWELWFDGKRVKKADWIGDPVFAPVGDDYAVWIGEDVRVSDEYGGESGKYVCTWGRKKADGFTAKPWRDPQWSADGKHLGFLGYRHGRHIAVLDGKEFGPYSYASGFCWSPDGKLAAWVGSKSYSDFRIHTPKKSFGENYEQVGAPALGPDGAMAHLARIRGRAALIFKEELVPGFYDDLGTPAVSPDGAHVVVSAQKGGKEEDGDWFVDNSWMDGGVDEARDAVAAAENGRRCLLLRDGLPLGGEWRRIVRPFFSPEGGHLAARAQSAEGWHLLLDEHASPGYEEIFEPRFSADEKSLSFGARRGRELMMVKIVVE